MILCTVCMGKGRYEIGGQYRKESVTCSQCDGSGVLIDPQLERLIEAVEKVAQKLEDIRYIAERETRGGGHRQ